MSDDSGLPAGPPIICKPNTFWLYSIVHTKKIVSCENRTFGPIRRCKKKINVSTESSDDHSIESKILEPQDEILESQPSAIQILFNNPNLDGSISDSAENLELQKKLSTEFETAEFNIEGFKTVRILMNMFQKNILEIWIY